MGHGSLRDAAYVAYMQEERMRELRRYGYSNFQIARLLGTTNYKVKKTIGSEPKAKRKGFTIHVQEPAYRKVREIAKDLGLYLRTGDTAGEGSISHLIEAIAAGVIHVTEYEQRDEDEGTVHLPDFSGEVADLRGGDDRPGKVSTWTLQQEPGFLPLADAGATGSGEAGTENLLPKHHEVLQDGDGQ